MTTFSSNAVSNRVVSLNGLGRDRSPGQRILGESRDHLVSLLCAWLREVATPVSEELFVLADSTRERLLQTRYLDLRAAMEKDWSHLVETFRRALSAEAERCQNQDSAKGKSTDSPLEIPDFEGLQLVDDDDLSEHIVIREFSAQLAESCDEELYTLDRRVSVLLGHDDLVQGANPLAPAVICRALSEACVMIGDDAESRLILLRRLERHLHISLPNIYQKINGNLIERGILPDLKRTYRRSAVATDDSSTFDSPTGAPRGSGRAVETTRSVQAESGQNILEALQRLAQLRTTAQTPVGSIMGAAREQLSGETDNLRSAFPGSIPEGAIGGDEPLDPLALEQLFASLGNIQRASTVDSQGILVNQVRLVRESESARHVGGMEAVTLDIVAMLFDFILDDSHIPVAIKALISRLQIPVLKVAMQNPGFFADRQHPTRRFLGSVSGVSIRWGNSVDESDPFYAKLAELVDRIQSEFESDVDIFGTALVELQAFVDEREREDDRTAQAAANVVIQHEKIAEARERAQRIVDAFRTEHEIPPLLDGFLADHWGKALQAIAAQGGEGSDDWHAAIDLMKDLVWSVEPKKSPDDRLKLVGLLPKLLGQLNRGFDSVAADAAQRKDFLDALMRCHSGALKGETVATVRTEPPAQEPSFAPPQEGDLMVTHSVDNGVDVEEVVLVGASPIWRADDRDIFRQVSDLKRGDWVEFRDEEGNLNRERLNWISPQRGILLFSNHRSSKAISIAPDALARQIRDNKAWIVSEEPIFERALSGALETISAN